ncbi:MAG: hypothetical protein ABW168_25560 [Sedimenticola sp.]
MNISDLKKLSAKFTKTNAEKWNPNRKYTIEFASKEDCEYKKWLVDHGHTVKANDSGKYVYVDDISIINGPDRRHTSNIFYFLLQVMEIDKKFKKEIDSGKNDIFFDALGLQKKVLPKFSEDNEVRKTQYFTPKYMGRYIKKAEDKERKEWLTLKIYQLRAQIKNKCFNNRGTSKMDDLDIQICKNTLDRLLIERNRLLIE